MKIGFAVSDITPRAGIYLTGYGRPERMAEGVHSPLCATVMVLQDGKAEAAVVGLDWCFVDWSLTQVIRDGIQAVTGISKSNILLCCSHTHSAPHTTYMRTLGRIAVDPENHGIEYVLQSVPAIADAVKQAQKNLRNCVAGFSATKTLTGVSRRGTDENGKVRGFIADPDQIYDDNLTTARFLDRETGEDIGIFVHCSAHNTAMGGDRRISSDWCGVMRSRIHDRYQAPVIFVNGAIGDVGPRTNCFVQEPLFSGFAAGGGNGSVSAEEVGLRAATDALRALEGIKDFRSNLSLATHCGELRLPQAISMSESEARETLLLFDGKAGKSGDPDIRYQIAQASMNAYQQQPEPELVLEQSLIAFGPIALVPFPFEIFSIFSLRLRKYGPFAYTLPCSNTNGRNAYLPDRGSFAMGGYEPECLKTIRPYVVTPDAGDIAVTQSLASLRQLKQIQK